MTTEVFPGSRYWRTACGRERTGMPRRAASAASTLSRKAALPTTTTSASGGTCSAAKPFGHGDLRGAPGSSTWGGRASRRCPRRDDPFGAGGPPAEPSPSLRSAPGETAGFPSCFRPEFGLIETFSEISRDFRGFRRFGIPTYRRKLKMRHVLNFGRLALAALLVSGVALAQKLPTTRSTRPLRQAARWRPCLPRPRLPRSRLRVRPSRLPRSRSPRRPRKWGRSPRAR